MNNAHFDYMALNAKKMFILSKQLHFDDGHSDLSKIQVFDWEKIYGTYDALMEQLKATAPKRAT